MEQHLGRQLCPDEHVDHKDEDKTNDVLSNLQVLSAAENTRKMIANTRPKGWVTFICPVCKKEATKSARDVRGNRKKGKAGPFCSRSCAGKFSHT
jgi:hypothetical protein